MTEHPQSATGSDDVARRELWKNDYGDRTAIIRVHRDGSEQIEELPELARPEVRDHLRNEDMHFVRLIPGDHDAMKPHRR